MRAVVLSFPWPVRVSRDRSSQVNQIQFRGIKKCPICPFVREGLRMSSPLQKFDPAKSRWRFVKVAFDPPAPHPAYRHVLLALARYANEHGVCYPSHHRLLDDTGYGTKTTIVNALKHWKGVGVLKWKKGWGNAHGRRSNVYQFDYDTMLALSLMKDHSASDEQPLSTDEEPQSNDEQLTGRGRITTRPNTKAPAVEIPKRRTTQLPRRRVRPPRDRKQDRSVSTGGEFRGSPTWRLFI